MSGTVKFIDLCYEFIVKNDVRLIPEFKRQAQEYLYDSNELDYMNENKQTALLYLCWGSFRNFKMALEMKTIIFSLIDRIDIYSNNQGPQAIECLIVEQIGQKLERRNYPRCDFGPNIRLLKYVKFIIIRILAKMNRKRFCDYCYRSLRYLCTYGFRNSEMAKFLKPIVLALIPHVDLYKIQDGRSILAVLLGVLNLRRPPKLYKIIMEIARIIVFHTGTLKTTDVFGIRSSVRFALLRSGEQHKKSLILRL